MPREINNAADLIKVILDDVPSRVIQTPAGGSRRNGQTGPINQAFDTAARASRTETPNGYQLDVDLLRGESGQMGSIVQAMEKAVTHNRFRQTTKVRKIITEDDR